MERNLLSKLLSLQCTLFQIPFYLYDGEIRLEAFEPHTISCDLVIPWLTPLINTNDSPNYLLTKDLLLLGRVIDNSSGLQIIIGPTRIGRILEKSLHSIVLSGRPLIGVEHLQEVGKFLNSCATFSLEQFLPLLCSLHGFLNHEIILLDDLIKKDTSTPHVFNTQMSMISATLEHTYAETPRRNNFDLESEILFYVSHGMTTKIKGMQLMHTDMGNLAPESLRHYKNALIILNTLCQRAAIIGGLDPEISYQLGEIYIQKIEACRNIDSLLQINVGQKLILDYCERVALVIHPKTKHPKINTVMHYVRENYQKRLTVEEIANEVGFSKEYLSTKFHQITGITLPTYINQQKITEAKQLLHFTTMSLSEISEYLSFSSQSYFQTIFKKISGDTPMEYRLKNKIFT
jgi:AraC-like DNA-binding protein